MGISKNTVTYTTMSLVFLAGLIPIGISGYSDYQVYRYGKIVPVVIKKIPRLTGSKGDFMDFELNGKVYSMKIGNGLSDELKVGDTISLKHLSGYDYNFMLPNDNPTFWVVVAPLVMLFFTGLCLHTAFKKQT